MPPVSIVHFHGHVSARVLRVISHVDCPRWIVTRGRDRRHSKSKIAAVAGAKLENFPWSVKAWRAVTAIEFCRDEFANPVDLVRIRLQAPSEAVEQLPVKRIIVPIIEHVCYGSLAGHRWNRPFEIQSAGVDDPVLGKCSRRGYRYSTDRKR